MCIIPAGSGGGTELQFSLVHFIKLAPFINATLRPGEIGTVICLSESISLSSFKRFILFAVRKFAVRRSIFHFSVSIRGETS